MEIKDIVAAKKYLTKNGQEKTRWTTVGQLFIKDDGKMVVKFEDYINPLAFRNEKGDVWLNVYDRKPKEQNGNGNGNGNGNYNYTAPTNPTKAEQARENEQVQAEGKEYAKQWRNKATAPAQAPAEVRVLADVFGGDITAEEVPF